MIFCARATRGLRRPSPGLMARLGVPVGGRVRKLRAVGDQSGQPIFFSVAPAIVSHPLKWCS